jgi:shikimate dehydrogenase
VTEPPPPTAGNEDAGLPIHPVTGRTRVYLHLAHPSSHVRTPQVMNRAFTDRGIDAVAVSVDVAPADLGDFVRGLHGWRNLAGLGVTMPHKQALTAYMDSLAGQARFIGAVNAVRREPDGSLAGANTDGLGFVAGLRSAGCEPAGRRALLAGAGGAGWAIAYALADSGVAALTLANRSHGRAEQLATEIARDIPGVTVAAGPPDPAGHDLVINATSLGMQPGDPLPVPAERLAPGTVVCDIIMSPPHTRLLQEAERRGCVAVPGMPMLACQVDLVIEFLGLKP